MHADHIEEVLREAQATTASATTASGTSNDNSPTSTSNISTSTGTSNSISTSTFATAAAEAVLAVAAAAAAVLSGPAESASLARGGAALGAAGVLVLLCMLQLVAGPLRQKEGDICAGAGAAASVSKAGGGVGGVTVGATKLAKAD